MTDRSELAKRLPQRDCGCSGLQMCVVCADTEGAKDARASMHHAFTAEALSSPSTMDEASIRAQAEATVTRVRGSNDVPGYEACVKAEMDNIRYAYLREILAQEWEKRSWTGHAKLLREGKNIDRGTDAALAAMRRLLTVDEEMVERFGDAYLGGSTWRRGSNHAEIAFAIRDALQAALHPLPKPPQTSPNLPYTTRQSPPRKLG